MNKTNNLIKEGAKLNKVIDFVKYHNAFTIGLMLIFVFSGAIFASEDLRDAVVGEEVVTKTGVDNTQLLAADLENFDLAMTINDVKEDEKKYYIDYSFNTIGIKDNIWQPLVQRMTMEIPKTALGNNDLGLYLIEELNEAADYQMRFLLEVQKAEKEKGETKIVETKEYTGLVGLVLDIKNKVLPGYEPVVQPPEPEPVHFIETIVQPEPEPQSEPSTPSSSEPAPPTPQPTPPTPEPEPTPQPEPEATPTPTSQPTPPAPTPTPEPSCDSEHLNLCTTQELCQGANLYWYNDACNLEPEALACPEGFSDCDNDMTNGCEYASSTCSTP